MSLGTIIGRVSILVALTIATGCNGQKTPPADTPADQQQASACGPAPAGTKAQTLTIREATSPEFAGHQVAPTNIFERDLPDDTGKVARRVSSRLSIMQRATRKEWTEMVILGSRIQLGNETWCVEQLVMGESEPGSMTLRRMAP